MTVLALEAPHVLVEAMIGRRLSAAEQNVDVLKLDAALNRAKDELERAIEAEKRRAIRRHLDLGLPVTLELTRPMLAPLERLVRLGVREANAELRRAGYEPRRFFAAEPEYVRLRPLARLIRLGLNALGIRVEEGIVEASIGEVATDTVYAAALRVLGSRGIAAEVVSSALTSGLSFTFEANEDLVGGWEYSAILDGATCPRCSALDGTTYDSWAAIQVVLPGGGPNPSCFGGGRCRCRAVPLPASSEGQAAPAPAGPSRTADTLAADILARARHTEARVTRDMQELPGRLEGFDFRLKTQGSLARKIRSDAIKDEITETKAASLISDGLRYTKVFDPGDYAAGTRATVNALRGRGYSVAKWKDTWDSEMYKGINAVFRDPSGHRLELQFHTPESFDIKNRVNHPLYESWRTSKDVRERVTLESRMRRNIQRVSPPPDLAGYSPL